MRLPPGQADSSRTGLFVAAWDILVVLFIKGRGCVTRSEGSDLRRSAATRPVDQSP